MHAGRQAANARRDGSQPRKRGGPGMYLHAPTCLGAAYGSGARPGRAVPCVGAFAPAPQLLELLCRAPRGTAAAGPLAADASIATTARQRAAATMRASKPSSSSDLSHPRSPHFIHARLHWPTRTTDAWPFGLATQLPPQGAPFLHVFMHGAKCRGKRQATDSTPLVGRREAWLRPQLGVPEATCRAVYTALL